MTDYESRAKAYGFASKDEIKAALSKPHTVIMDVRTAEEIAADGRVHSEHPWVQTNCTPDDCERLRAAPEEFVKDKSADAVIVIHCKSGRRAAAAKQVLIEKGYLGTILNAGGYCDIVEFFN